MSPQGCQVTSPCTVLAQGWPLALLPRTWFSASSLAEAEGDSCGFWVGSSPAGGVAGGAVLNGGAGGRGSSPWD